jgi:TolA-binding protein
MDRLIWETEYDFEGTEIMRRQKPRVLTPVDSGMRFGQDAFGRPAEIPQFLKDLMIEQTRLQPVKVKLDSVIIKGSKILKQHPKSDYVEGTLLLMAKSFFYQSEWVSAEIKCAELIDRFPLGDMSPDAHLLLSKVYLIQRKYALGKTMLSRTADIAWYKKRYDILSEAFRLMAEQAIFDNDEVEAVRPYRQAIAQSDDGEIRARWQLDLASLYYRLGKFDRALKEFNAVLDESPELVQEFEAELYKASCLMYLNKHEEAQVILDDLDGNENFKDYKPDILAQRLRMLRIQGKKEEFDKMATEAQKYAGFIAIPVVYFEQAMDLYKKGKYEEAKSYFAKSKPVKSQVSQAASKYYGLIAEWGQKHDWLNKSKPSNDSSHIDSIGVNIHDSLRTQINMLHYQLARIHDQLHNQDSALHYYTIAAKTAIPTDSNRAQYLFSFQKMIRKDQPELADSILEILAYDYGKTEYGQEARIQMGFTDAVVIDTLAELYSSGIRFRNISNYVLAARQFNRIAEEYRDSPLAPKALYSLGWMFENTLMQPDSAIYYYRLLVERYPQSEYAKDVRAGVEIALAHQSGLYDISTGKFKDRTPKVDTIQVPAVDTTTKNDAQIQQKNDNSRTLTDPNINQQKEPLKQRRPNQNNQLINPNQPMQLPVNAPLPGNMQISLPQDASPADSMKIGDPP